MYALKTARFLVTGGAGFIGSNLVEHLLREEARLVRVLDDFSTGRRANLAPFEGRIEVLEEDLRDPSAAKKAVDGIDYVLHQAAIPSVPRSIEQPGPTTSVNVGGTVNLLHAASRASVKRVVFASSSSVYGDSEALPKHENMPLCPLSPYAASKAAGELFCKSFGETYGLKTVALRYFNIFGPHQDPTSQYAAVIPKFISAVREGHPLPIFGDGLQTRDFTYIANVVDANIEACFEPEAVGGVFNVGCGGQISLLDLVETLGEVMGCETSVDHLPPRAGDVRDSMADIARARKQLHYEPRITLREGLELTAAHFLARAA